MKKSISLLLSVIMLFSAGAMAVSAEEKEENLCDKFEHLEDLHPFGATLSPFSIFTMAEWTTNQTPQIYDDYYFTESEGNIDEDGYCYEYKVPAELFEKRVGELFALDKSVNELVLEAMEEDPEYPSVKYYEDTDEYAYFIGGYGGPKSWSYQFIGYTKNTDNYSVYIEKMPDLFDSLEELLGGTDEPEDSENIKVNEDGKYYVALPKESESHVKMTVNYDGKNVQIITSEEIDERPNDADLIVPEEKPTETPKVDYDTPEGIEIEGDTAFPENTVVKVENVSKGEIFERAEKSLSNVAEKGKIAVFEFSATKDNATVQPNGKVKVSFDLPANLSADNLKMFYVTEDSKTEEIAITVDKENKTVTAELEHFSTYVLCNVKTTPPTDTDTTNGNDTTSNETTNPQTGETTNIALCAVLMFASLSALAVLTYIKKKQHNH